ncbi:MAG: hypothetical protein HeimC2_25270 [Candidatus Heimdallarchaeota archaeon LC_2]|nr:MAG: hypothetical protein HeimC2_25270 [Candidatus Heimdallarchaeota archaeon LC_2]
MEYNFNGKKFRITHIEGPDTEVNEKTIFHFHQENDVIWGEYSGGKVKLGRLIGIITGNKLKHNYIQINLNNEINSGEGNSTIQQIEESKLQIVEEWEWKSQTGKGKSVMTEL